MLEHGTDAGGPVAHVAQRAREVIDHYGHRPQWRGRLHQVAAAVALPAGIVLVVTAHGVTGRVASAIYATSLVALFAVSAAYHRVAHSERAVKWFRKLDHSMIFLLIAGSYTPLCLLVLPPAWGIPLLSVIWAAALAGITVKMLRVGAKGSTGASWLYIVMGWAAVVAIPVLVDRLSTVQLVLLAAGGALYTLGAIGLWKRWPDPSPDRFGYHEVWHSMTVAASGCHFALIVAIIR
ncbi:MAG: PAQR family membrane homeostasis protein TrhA [Microthrixaceae bacterium]